MSYKRLRKTIYFVIYIFVVVVVVVVSSCYLFVLGTGWNVCFMTKIKLDIIHYIVISLAVHEALCNYNTKFYNEYNKCSGVLHIHILYK